MKEWLSEFWNTKAGFERTIRSALFLVGSLMQIGAIPNPGPDGWVGAIIPIILQGGALGIAAGQKNVSNILK